MDELERIRLKRQGQVLLELLEEADRILPRIFPHLPLPFCKEREKVRLLKSLGATKSPELYKLIEATTILLTTAADPKSSWNFDERYRVN